jgi:hypothetical protein
VARPKVGSSGRGAEESPTVALSEGARRFKEAEAWVVEETRGDRVRAVDVKRYVAEVEVSRNNEDEWVLGFTAAVTPAGTARPELVLKAVGQASGLRLATPSICRTRIRLD